MRLAPCGSSRAARALSAGAVALGLGVAASAPALAADITIDASARHQTIEGWGTSLATWSNDTPYDDIRFRNAYRDAGMNILRIPLVKSVLVDDSGDFTVPVLLGHDMATNVGLTDFGGNDVQTMGSLAQWLKTNALEPDRVKIVGSSWSPPHWMKGPTGAEQYWTGDPGQVEYPTPWLSGQHSPWHGPQNTGDSIGGRLKTEDPVIAEQFGLYMATWVSAWEAEFGVPLHAISIQNESTFENPFDSMAMDRGPYNETTGTSPEDFAQYARALKSVKDAWEQFQVGTKIKGPHTANVGPTPENPHLLRRQIGMIQAVKNFADDPDLIDFLDYYNANYYMGTSEAAVKATAGYFLGTDAVDADWGADWGVTVGYPGVGQDGKPIWYSETGGAQAPWLNGGGGTTPGNGAITVAQKMHNALVYSDAAAYIYWQMSDASNQETTHTLLGQDHLDDPLASKKLAAFMHFSRFVRPGAVRVDATFDSSGESTVGGGSEYDTFNGLNVSAFLHDEDGTATIVLLNMMGQDELLDIDVPWADLITSYDVYLTDETHSFAQMASLDVTNGAISLLVPEYSVITLHGVAVPEPAAIGTLAGAALLLLRRRRVP